MRGDKFSNTLLSDSASRSKPSRIEIKGNEGIISIVIYNSSTSEQTLWLALNSSDHLQPIEPGQSVAIASRDNAYISKTTVSLAWDDEANTDNRVAIITTGIDTGEIKC